MPLLDWSQCPAVERIPGKVSGAWVLRNTRMPVATIFENLEAGANVDDILTWYDGLNREQVKAVIEFAARSPRRASGRALNARVVRSGTAGPDSDVVIGVQQWPALEPHVALVVAAVTIAMPGSVTEVDIPTDRPPVDRMAPTDSSRGRSIWVHRTLTSAWGISAVPLM